MRFLPAFCFSNSFWVSIASGRDGSLNATGQSLDAEEALGVVLQSTHRETSQEQEQRERQMRITELESKQKMWRWLIVAAIGVLMIETWLAGSIARRVQADDLE